MIDFPAATIVHRRMPKEAFYKHIPLAKAIKESFISDVERIFVENSLTKENLNLVVDAHIKEILVLSILLKKQEFDARIIEVIARQNPHRLVFLLMYEEKCQLALYYSKLYHTPWLPNNEMQLKAKGFSLDEIWNTLVEQIALYEERAVAAAGASIEERLVLQEEIVKLERQIEKTEAAAWREQQPKKQFKIYMRLQAYKKKFTELKNG